MSSWRAKCREGLEHEETRPAAIAHAPLPRGPACFLIPVLVLAAILLHWGSGDAGVPHTVQVVAAAGQAEFVFTPMEVLLSVGRPVTITVVNKGKVEHDWLAESLGVSIKPVVPPGKSGSVTFTPSRRGSFEFHCTVPGHKEAGMKGMLVVR